MKNPWTGWKAYIAPNEYGTYGVHWRDAPAMESRGGYSGPYESQAAARQGVLDWIKAWDMDPETDIDILLTDGIDPESGERVF